MAAATAEKMQCMEVWGGNHATWSHFTVPGLDLWVYSQPLAQSSQGGDVYYLSSCASGRITRMLLADVSGHGDEAAPVATRLRDLMRRNVNFIAQSRMTAALNDDFEGTERFATACISTFFAPTRSLSLSSAGHPPALIYRRSKGRWVSSDDETETGRNMPIGVVEGVAFSSGKLKLDTGDLVLSYSDALFEAKDEDDEILKTEGLLRLINETDTSQPELVVSALLDRIRDLDPCNLTADDVTVMLAKANGTGTTLKDNLLAPIRLLGRMLRLR